MQQTHRSPFSALFPPADGAGAFCSSSLPSLVWLDNVAVCVSPCSEKKSVQIQRTMSWFTI